MAPRDSRGHHGPPLHALCADAGCGELLHLHAGDLARQWGHNASPTVAAGTQLGGMGRDVASSGVSTAPAVRGRRRMQAAPVGHRLLREAGKPAGSGGHCQHGSPGRIPPSSRRQCRCASGASCGGPGGTACEFGAARQCCRSCPALGHGWWANPPLTANASCCCAGDCNQRHFEAEKLLAE